jgi:PP-loop superfamily ATP-utilizing enzyme
MFLQRRTLQNLSSPGTLVKIVKFKEVGFNYVSLALQGYRAGSMNEALRGKSL